MKLLTTLLFLLVLFTSTVTWGQANGDYRSVVSGNWDAIATWETYDLSTTSWIAASVKPGSTNNVWVQATHLITLTMNEACNDIHLASASAPNYGRVATVTFTLEVNGKMRTYSGALPGTNVSNPVNPPFTKSVASSSGLVKIVGNTRNVTNTGEFGSFSATAPSTNASIEIAMNPGQTAVFQTAGKFASWNISSGTLDFTGRLSVDFGTTTLGNVTVANGATLISNSTGTVMSRTSSGLGGVFTLNGMWILKGAAPAIGMTTINLNGTVQYDAAAPQTMLTTITGGASPSTYNNLILSNSGAKTLGLHTTVNGTLSLQGTANLSLSTFTLTYGGSANLEYAGSSNQTTADAELPVSGGPNNLIINNSNGTNLHASRSIAGVLTLTSGLFTLGTSNLTLGSAATVSVGSATNYIDVSGGGVFSRELTADGLYNFPIGNGAYSPVSLTLSGATYSSASLSVDAFNVKHPQNTSLTDYLNRYWNVTASGITLGSYNADFVYDNGDIAGTEASLLLGRYDGSLWSIAGIVTAATNTLSGTGLTSFSDFTGGEGSSLPIELSSFNSSLKNNSIQLTWKTTSEVNSSMFEVQRKSETSEWIKVGDVAATGNSNSPKDYNFIDIKLNCGKYSYRLKMIDADGRFDYSEAVEAEITLPSEYAISQNYPNPFNPTTRIDYQLPFDSKVTLELYEITGEKMATLINSELTAGYYTADVNASELNLASGVYIYRMSASNQPGQNFVQVKKLMLTK